MATNAVEPGAVFVGPHDGSHGAVVHHEIHGAGTVSHVGGASVIVEHFSGTAKYAATWAKQKPKLVLTGSEQGKTCLANIRVDGDHLYNKDDGKYLGLVKKDYTSFTIVEWHFIHDSSGKYKSGFQTKHQAIKALVEHHNIVAHLNKPKKSLFSLSTDSGPASDYKSLEEVAKGYVTPAPAVPSEAEPDAGSAKPPTPQGQPHANDAWKNHKVEVSGGDLYGANPVKNAAGQIVAGEICHAGIVIGYTSSNGDGTMKVFHADGTLVVNAAIPGNHTATDAVAAHHTKHHSGAAEKAAAIKEKIAKILVEGEKIQPSELSLAPGGLHCDPMMSYAKPLTDSITQHFSDTVTTTRGATVYDLVPGAHLLPLEHHQLAALKSYTASGFESINNQLRAGKVTNQGIATLVASLDSIYLQTPELEETIEVFRGIDKHTAALLLGEVGSHVGQTFVEPGFSSCSAYVSSAFTAGSNIIIRVTVPRGSHVIKPSLAGHFGDKEREILLPRAAKFLMMRDEMIEKPSGASKRQVDLVFTGSHVNHAA